jgi:hypothetical protein
VALLDQHQQLYQEALSLLEIRFIGWNIKQHAEK